MASLHSPSNKIGITAVVVPRVTCDLPLYPIPFGITCPAFNLLIRSLDFLVESTSFLCRSVCSSYDAWPAVRTSRVSFKQFLGEFWLALWSPVLLLHMW